MYWTSSSVFFGQAFHLKITLACLSTRGEGQGVGVGEGSISRMVNQVTSSYPQVPARAAVHRHKGEPVRDLAGIWPGSLVTGSRFLDPGRSRQMQADPGRFWQI